MGVGRCCAWGRVYVLHEGVWRRGVRGGEHGARFHFWRIWFAVVLQALWRAQGAVKNS